jgi:hypothetical protein
VPNRGYTLVADREALGPARREMPEDEEKTLYYRLLRDRLSGKLPTRVNELELAQTYGVPRPLLRTCSPRCCRTACCAGATTSAGSSPKRSTRSRASARATAFA